ncbi:MAG: cysteine desulfurase [Planctomycetes bacterium]|nr:cysteine desulfurase [Planctomycetota bacterium]
MSEARIYLDHNATTPVDPRVLAAMLPWFTEHYGNAASATHGLGCDAAGGVESARATIAAAINAQAKDVIFTSGATEAINLAIQGVARHERERGRHLVTVETEHRAVLETCEVLQAEGWDVTIVGVDRHGCVDPAAIAAALRPDTVLVSVMLANNEIGTLHDVAAIGKLTRERGVFLHVDAAQALGKIPVDAEALSADLMSLSAHKLYGPKGVGALYVRRRDPRVRLAPMIHGGGHERGLRSGTLNVPGIIGFATAVEIAIAELPTEQVRIQDLAQRLWRGLEMVREVRRLGHPEQRLANTVNVLFAGIDAKRLLMDVPRVAASLGAACTSVMPKPSHVLRAIGVDWRAAEGAVRFSLGRFTTAAEIDEAILIIADGVRACRIRRPLSASNPVSQEV